MSSEEHVLVIPESRLDQAGGFTGFRPFCDRTFQALLDQKYMEFRPRSSVEEDPSYKQLIPYVILQTQVDGQPHLFHYTRGTGQGEARLHSFRSIGIGGHISREDANRSKATTSAEDQEDPSSSHDIYRIGMLRELNEETIIDCEYNEELVGFIYDDSSPVGRVHLGVVHRLHLSDANARAREVDLAESGFAAVSHLKNDRDRFETWSQLVMKHLFR